MSSRDVSRWDRVVEKTTLVSGTANKKTTLRVKQFQQWPHVSPFLELSGLAEILSAEQEPPLPGLARERSCSLGAPGTSRSSMDRRRRFSCSFWFCFGFFGGWYNVNINFFWWWYRRRMEQENFINLVKKSTTKVFLVMWKWSNVAFNEFDFFCHVKFANGLCNTWLS